MHISEMHKIPLYRQMIGRSAFEDCQQLAEVGMSEGLEQIEGYAFQSCKSLKGAKIPSTVKSIGVGAFRELRKLGTMRSKTAQH